MQYVHPNHAHFINRTGQPEKSGRLFGKQEPTYTQTKLQTFMPELRTSFDANLHIKVTIHGH